jgi:hypothetical protein
MAHVFHDTHPEFAVRGEVEARSAFNVDLLALVRAWPEDWRRLREQEEDISEAVNTLVCDVLIEGEEWGPAWEPKGFLRVRTDEPEVDWRAPHDAADFWPRFTAALIAEGLWGDNTTPEDDGRRPGPGQLALVEEDGVVAAGPCPHVAECAKYPCQRCSPGGAR